MNRLAAIIAVAALTLGCGQTSPQTTVGEQTSTPPAATPVAFNALGAPTVAFSVPDMMCEFSCVPTVRETLAKQPGVKDVKVELDSKTATVAVDSNKFDADAAVAALVDLQFTNTKLTTAARGDDSAAQPGADSDAPAADAEAAEENVSG